ncbi:MAG: PD40 domain-containing protein, partial [Planctomycetes bacterium]|nr:PD40 domain-containing protein [Planctomycetota bacterium]
MQTKRSAKFARVKRAFRSRRGPVIVGTLLLIGLIVWLLPRRVDRVVPADGTASWDAENAPPRRQVVWKSPEEISNLLPDDSPSTRLATPRLTDGGATLYLTRRDENGRADIYRARLLDGRWQPAMPVAELNTAGDEIGPALSRDGQELFFYSNRPGGRGGFDLYVSSRKKNGWSVPRNLGDRVNTAADEYSPAISPDGKTLYFASNRTSETVDSQKTAASREVWNATIRTRRGKRTFDLFASRRDGGDWRTPEPLARLNRKDSSEGTPYPSPDGAFLYFASDRKSRPGEKRNLDLYRARIVNGRIGRAENLGPRINTAAHETEPALSPEGFTLLFSSDRFDGKDRLFSSSAQEVFVEQEWDTSHLSVIPSFWWWTLAASLLVAVLLAVLTYRYRERMLEKVLPARFFFGSVLVNLLLLLLLAVWKLDVIELIAQGLSDHQETETPVVRGVIDSSGNSDGDARKAFERVDDLTPVKRTAESQSAIPQVDDTAAMNRVELSIPKTVTKRVPFSPSRNVILLKPPERRLEPARKQPVKQQVVNRMALVRREPVQLAKLENNRLEPAQKPDELKI